MKRYDEKYNAYIEILKEELRVAMGCTEPIAVAYAAAKAKEVLGGSPNKVEIEVSGNILKNVKSVVVPNTNNLKGIRAAAAAGIVAGDASKELEVIAEVEKELKAEISECIDNTEFIIKPSKSDYIFDIAVTEYLGESYAKIRIINAHTNIVLIEKDGKIILSKEENMACEASEDIETDRSLLNVKDIIEFANIVDIKDIEEVIRKQIDYNSAIANEGIQNAYGANIGKVILETYDSKDIKTRLKAMAAAGSDARMSGCELPVVIVSGSGNQGMTASVPVIEYARYLGAGDDKLIRAVALSDLITIHQKTDIGKLSAYCGAVSAGVGSAAAIAYLDSGGYSEIAHTIVNALNIVSGIICDGAKSSCAAKIAASVDAGLLGYYMYKNGQQFRKGEGLVSVDVESSIKNIGKLGKIGMKETDKEIIKMMIDE